MVIWFNTQEKYLLLSVNNGCQKRNKVIFHHLETVLRNLLCYCRSTTIRCYKSTEPVFDTTQKQQLHLLFTVGSILSLFVIFTNECPLPPLKKEEFLLNFIYNIKYIHHSERSHHINYVTLQL